MYFMSSGAVEAQNEATRLVRDTTFMLFGDGEAAVSTEEDPIPKVAGPGGTVVEESAEGLRLRAPSMTHIGLKVTSSTVVVDFPLDDKRPIVFREEVPFGERQIGKPISGARLPEKLDELMALLGLRGINAAS